MGMPHVQIVHSDQGQNFESVMLKQTLEAFGMQKSNTSSYHPQGNGLVERFNRSLLHLSYAYNDKEFDWEQHLHSSTGISPHMLMFGSENRALLFDCFTYFDSGCYQHYLRDKNWLKPI